MPKPDQILTRLCHLCKRVVPTEEAQVVQVDAEGAREFLCDWCLEHCELADEEDYE